MAGQYSYPPPPPPPPSASTNGYASYGASHPYPHQPSRGGPMGVGGGRGRGHHAGGPNRGEYGQPYGGYQHQAYPAANGTGAYSHQPQAGYWQGSPGPQMGHHSQTSHALPQSQYPQSYAHQGYQPQQHASYQPASYPADGQRSSYQPSYGPTGTSDYPPAQSWADNGSSYSQYSGRGGRGGYQSDRGGHATDPASAPVIRMGFDQGPGQSPQASAAYAPSYPPPPQHHPSMGYPHSSYPVYPPTPGPAPSYGGSAHHSSSHRGRGRDFSNGSRGRQGHNDRNDKFRHKGQKPHHDQNNAPKFDNSIAKKKKRKTNTLGLTPGDDEESDDGAVDEESRLVEILGSDAPIVSDVAAWLAERKASFPTKARIAAKQAAEQAKIAEVGEGQKPVVDKISKDEEKAEKLRRQLAKVERKLEKRKREANDEGDEMRIDEEEESSESSSEDEKPEAQSSRKSASQLPPSATSDASAARADPTAHCKYYSTGGICGKKGKCRFKHDPQVREQALQEQAMNGGRMTLKQRLLRNDKDQDDLAIVQSIVAMRAAGKLQDTRQSTSSEGSPSLPPPNLTHPLPAKLEPSV